MNRNKLSIIFAVLTCVCIFSLAATYNQCQIQQEEKEAFAIKPEIYRDEEKQGVEEEEAAEEEEAQAEEEVAEEGADEEKEAPTIAVEIYEGPIYSPDDDVCYYRVKATVTGSPSPDVDWNRDDSDGAWGTRKAQVNLNDPSHTYTLTAIATNSEGTASDSINLDWGCIADTALVESSANLSGYEAAVLNLINNIRVSNGLGALQSNQILTDIARSRCSDMINRSYFSHYTPDGKNIFNMLRENGVSYVNAGENLGQSTPASNGTPEAFANEWMQSPTHKANILRSVYSKIGIGVIDGGVRRVVATVFTN